MARRPFKEIKMNSFSFDFDDLFVVAVKEWPAEVESNLISYDRKDPKKSWLKGWGYFRKK